MSKTKKALTAAALVGAGMAGWMMYKKKNPDAMHDAKVMAKNAASKMLTKLENME